MEEDVVVGGQLDLDFLRVEVRICIICVVGAAFARAADNADVDLLSRPVGCGLAKGLDDICIRLFLVAHPGKAVGELVGGACSRLIFTHRAYIDCHHDVVVNEQVLGLAHSEHDGVFVLWVFDLLFLHERIVFEETRVNNGSQLFGTLLDFGCIVCEHV